MKKDKTQNGTPVPPQEADETEVVASEPQSEQADQPETAESRLAELTAQLEALQATTGQQLTEQQAENTALLAAYSELARSLPGLVPELVGGLSLEEVQSSVVVAREAYSRIATSLGPLEDAGKGVGSFMGAGGGTRSSQAAGDDQPARTGTGRGVNLIYQALAGGKNGNLAR